MDSSTPNFLSKTTLAVLLICLSACSNDTKTKDDQTSTTQQSTPPLQTSLKPNKALDLFVAHANTAFDTLNLSAKRLRKATSIFLDKPSDQQLEICKKELAQTHLDYMATHLYRNTLVLAKIEHPELDRNLLLPEIIHSNNFRLDKHPIIPGYIDSVDGYPSSGLIFSEQALSADFLNNEHQFSDEAYVTLGFHSLGYLLLGGEKETQRDANSFKSLKHPKSLQPEYRRSIYTRLLVETIIEDINLLSQAWASQSGYYQLALKELSTAQFMTLIELAIKFEENELPKLGQQSKEGMHYLSHESKKAANSRQDELDSLQAALLPEHP